MPAGMSPLRKNDWNASADEAGGNADIGLLDEADDHIRPQRKDAAADVFEATKGESDRVEPRICRPPNLHPLAPDSFSKDIGIGILSREGEKCHGAACFLQIEAKIGDNSFRPASAERRDHYDDMLRIRLLHFQRKPLTIFTALSVLSPTGQMVFEMNFNRICATTTRHTSFRSARSLPSC